MKHLLVLLTLWSVLGHAQIGNAQNCSSVWVFKPYLSCGAGGSPDLSAAGVLRGYQELTSEWIEDGADDQQGLCIQLRDGFNNDPINKAAGLVGSLTQTTPIREDDRKGLKTYYEYVCHIVVNQHPVVNGAPNAACGTEANWIAQVGGAIPVNAEVRCLSCDELDNRPMPELVGCMQRNISEIVNTGAVQFPAGSLDPMKDKVQAIMNYAADHPISNLQSFQEIMLFENFLK